MHAEASHRLVLLASTNSTSEADVRCTAVHTDSLTAAVCNFSPFCNMLMVFVACIGTKQ